MKHLVYAAIGAVSLLVVAIPATAATVIVTYSGTVGSGIDVDGLFGAAGANLKRQAYSLSFTTDTSVFQSFSGTRRRGSDISAPSWRP